MVLSTKNVKTRLSTRLRSTIAVLLTVKMKVEARSGGGLYMLLEAHQKGVWQSSAVIDERLSFLQLRGPTSRVDVARTPTPTCQVKPSTHAANWPVIIRRGLSLSGRRAYVTQ